VRHCDRDRDGALAHVAARKPNSISRRTASLNDGRSGCRFAQASTAARASGASLNPIIGSRPVAGRPVFFLAGLRAMRFGLT
jgi:hypothetical protein